VASLLDSHKGTLKVVYRHFPLVTIHDKAHITAEAAEAAGAQGKFLEMHRLLYARQQEWATQPAANTPQVLEGYAKEIGLDTARFSKELTEGKYRDKVKASYDTAEKVGFPGTPTFLINGIYVPNEYFGAADVLIPWLGWVSTNPKQFNAPEKIIDPAKKYTATLKTAKGDIVLELYADRTPTTVNSFVFLAKNKFYDGVTFHRVLPDANGLVAQAGDPSGTDLGGPGFQCNDELDRTLTFANEGVLAVANSDPNTNGSQFFITLGPRPDLNGKHTIFGRVVSGMDVVKKLAPRDPQKDPSAPPGDVIQSVVVEEK